MTDREQLLDELRPASFAIAYRMLGSVSDAEADPLHLNPHGYRIYTLRIRRTYWNKWVARTIGHVKLRSLSVQHVLLVTLAKREAGLASATINNALTTMARVFDYGVAANLLSSNPTKEITREGAAEPRELPITKDETLPADL